MGPGVRELQREDVGTSETGNELHTPSTRKTHRPIGFEIVVWVVLDVNLNVDDEKSGLSRRKSRLHMTKMQAYVGSRAVWFDHFLTSDFDPVFCVSRLSADLF